MYSPTHALSSPSQKVLSYHDIFENDMKIVQNETKYLKFCLARTLLNIQYMKVVHRFT